MKTTIIPVIVGLVLLSSALQAQPLSGTKTIGGTAYDYATFTDAVSALTSEGVSGPVTFNVRDGVYSEQVALTEIPGAGSGSEIIFQSESGTSSNVTLTYAPASNPENYTLLLNGADYITFKDITISSTGSAYGRVIIIIGGANNNQFLDNRIIGVPTTSDLETFALVDSYTDVDNDNLFSGNYLQYGSFGFYLFSTSVQNETGNIIENNVFKDQYETGIYIRYQEGIEITGNEISSNTSNTGYRGMYIRQTAGTWLIEKNHIILSEVNGGTGVYFNSCNSITDTWGGFINNELVIKSFGNIVYGIRIYGGTWLNILYNSVEMLGAYPDSRALTISGTVAGSNIKIFNNIFANVANGYAVYCESTDGFVCDYNNLVSSGGNLAYWGGPLADLGAWRSASSQGSNSISVDPLFTSETDLHVSNTDLKSGTYLSYPTVDIDGETRDGIHPCMGADEFIYPALAGSYSIGSSGADFASFNEAVAALVNGGVRAKVDFVVQAGTYTEQLTITSIQNVSESNIVTFMSPDPDSTKVILTYSPSGIDDNFTLKLDNVSYVNLEHLTITTGGVTYGTVINISNASSNIHLKGNRIIGSQTAETNYGKLIDGMNGGVKQNLVFENNLFQYGSSGIDLIGNDGTGTRIAGNTFLDLAFWNIRLDHCDGAAIDMNTIRCNLSTDFSGIFFYYCDSGLVVTNNLLHAPNASASTGIYLYKSNASESLYSIISNNIISLRTSGTNGRALYNRESNYCKYYYNNAQLTGSLAGSSAMHLRTSGSNIQIKNNIISNFAGGYSIYSDYTPGITSNHNDFHTSGSYLGFWGTGIQSDLNAWQTSSGQDANSVSVDPQYSAADDPHFPNPALNDAGTPLAEVTDDIDGEMRDPVSPDIGADEFCLPPSASNKTGCTTRSITNLTATGENVKWYSDAALGNLVYSGSSFPTGHTTAGTYIYYATQTINESESQARMVSLTIYTTPGLPSTSDKTSCFGETTPALTATGINLKWYDDAVLSNLVHSGSPFSTGETDAGTYTYYATQSSAEGCESDAATSALVIHSIPATPAYVYEESCEGDAVPDLTVSGTNVKWYSDQALTNHIHDGNTLSPGVSSSAYYYYFSTQTVNGCESAAAYDTLWIKPIPGKPTANYAAACVDEAIPDLEATGVSVKWYNDALHSTMLHEGNVFTSGHTSVGVYPYYATQTVNGCESPDKLVKLSIHTLPGISIMEAKVLCEVDHQEYLLSSAGAKPGNSYAWSSSQGDLSSTIANPSVHPVDPGTYEYTLVQTIDSTGCNDSGSTSITINPNPTVSISIDTNPIDQGSSTNLNASGADTYQWSPATGLSSTTGSQVTASPDEITTYNVVGTNNFSCTGSDESTLDVNCTACGTETYFTPSGRFNFGCTNNYYKNNLDCSWTLLPSNVGNIALRFAPDSFDIKAGDFVRIYDGQDQTAELIGAYNNDNLPPDSIIGGNVLHIRFTTDGSNTGLGFQAQWSPGVVEVQMSTINDLKIYPNPANEKLYIEGKDMPGQSALISIYNSSGQMLINQEFSYRGALKEGLDISTFSPGQYIIKILTDDQVYTGKFIKE